MSARETIDRVFDGRVAVVQRLDGFRFSLDSLLLARFVEVRGRERVVDLGAGNGVISLSLAVLNDGVAVMGVELQQAMVERAIRGATLNGVGERVRILAGDVRNVEEVLHLRALRRCSLQPSLPSAPQRPGQSRPGAAGGTARGGRGARRLRPRRGVPAAAPGPDVPGLPGGTGGGAVRGPAAARPGAQAGAVRSLVRRLAPRPWSWPRGSRAPARA